MKIWDIFLNYLIFFVLIFFSLYVVRVIENIYVKSLILALIVLAVLIYFKRSRKSIEVSGDGFMRYSLICHNCNWEWMSNVTGDKKYAKKCPNCGDNSKIEIVGIRKVKKMPKRSHKELTSYFKK